MRDQGLPPIVDRDTRLLILGSLPGQRSLAASQYYAHPQNQFWQLLSRVIGSALPTGYDKRLAALARHHIGLWDVVASAVRPGSLDSSLREVEPNDLMLLVAALPALRAISFNGKTAARLGRRQLVHSSALVLVDLPSSSPAYTLAYEDKALRWSQLSQFLI